MIDVCAHATFQCWVQCPDSMATEWICCSLAKPRASSYRSSWCHRNLWHLKYCPCCGWRHGQESSPCSPAYMDLSKIYILFLCCLPLALLKVDYHVWYETAMSSTCRTTNPGGIQLALASIRLVHSSVVVALWSLFFSFSNYSSEIASVYNYLKGVVCLLQILLILQPSHHIAEAIHKPDLIIRLSLLHMFGLEVSIYYKSLAILPAI